MKNIHYYVLSCKKWKYIPAVRSNILLKLIFASCVWNTYYRLCVLVKDIGRWHFFGDFDPKMQTNKKKIDMLFLRFVVLRSIILKNPANFDVLLLSELGAE